jgi:hypothetical protein
MEADAITLIRLCCATAWGHGEVAADGPLTAPA